MREQLERIQAMQDVADKIDQLERDREMLNVDVRNRERILEEKKRRNEQAREQRKAAARQSDATQMKIEEAEAEIRKLQSQLNVTRHQKEYDAIRKMILSHQADIQKWEDEELNSLQAADDLATEIKRTEAQVAEAEAELEKMRADVARQGDEITARIDEQQQEHDRIRAQIGPGVLSAYERLIDASIRMPLARAKDRVCMGCHTQLTKQTEVRLLRGTEIVYCHSCGRMLLIAD